MPACAPAGDRRAKQDGEPTLTGGAVMVQPGGSVLPGMA
jgi:hypothetical protein